MQNRFETCLVNQCAPTLAGIKLGSLFTYTEQRAETIDALVSDWDHALVDKGIRVIVLTKRQSSALIYVYRPSLLMQRIADPDVLCFLQPYGYESDIESKAIARLQERVRQAERFPHEIGVFLGYPLADVKGFIQNRGAKYCASGMWKVYADAEQARHSFAQYSKCKAIYTAMYHRGNSIAKLAV